MFLVISFPSSVFANTLGEVGAAAGIANTLQGTAQIQSKGILDKAKQTVQNYEEAQNNKLTNINAINSEPVPLATQQNIMDPSLVNPTSHPVTQDTSLINPADHSVIQDPSLQSSDNSSVVSNPYSKEELDKKLQDEEIRQETQAVDYKRKFQVFYKRDCQASQKNCHRGAVLTNIKSLIFDYAHKRGSFSEIKKEKN